VGVHRDRQVEVQVLVRRGRVPFARRGAPFAGVSFRVPERVTAFVVTGLAPEAPYALTRAARDGLVEVSVRPGEGTAADAGGVVVSGVGR
jgi:hypothetical protein